MRTYDLYFRFIHWVMAICIFMMLATVFLRITFLNKTNVSAIIIQQSQEMGIEISELNAIKMAKSIRKPVWEWHIYFGYTLIGAYVLRFILAFTRKTVFLNPFKSSLNFKQKLQAYSYLFFYAVLFFALGTGFLIENGPKTWKEGLEGKHEFSHYFVLLFICIHFAGLYLAEKGEQKGIVSQIISGRD